VESLGFANFYQYFIKNFSHTVKPLNKLKGKKEWKWEKEYKKVFKELKNKITSQLALALSRREEKFRVETNISKYAIRGDLFQKQKEKWKLTAFLSKTIQAAKKNYEIYNKKLLAIVKALIK